MYGSSIPLALYKAVVPRTYIPLSSIRVKGLHTHLGPYIGPNTYVPGRVQGLKDQITSPPLCHTRANHAHALRALPLSVDGLSQAIYNYNNSINGTFRLDHNQRARGRDSSPARYKNPNMALDNEHIQDIIAHASKVLERVATSDKPTSALVYSNRFKCLPPKAEGKRSVGVLSASFNPMTLAHVTMATMARDTHDLDAVTLLLTVKNVDKSVFGASLPQRLAMLQAFLESSETAHWGQTDIVVCSHPRFVEAAQALGDIYPTDVWRPTFLLGYDTLTRFFDPKYYTDIGKSLETFFGLAEVIVYNRDDVTVNDVDEFIHTQSHGYDAQIDILDIKDQNLQCASSSEVRECVKSETQSQAQSQTPQSADYALPRATTARLCVPTAVKEFITQFKVYYATR
ncbi:hypothetical protein SARC_08218 [Sphaeroforma arctica JP610]|uniref:Cytidyltransferase-like domain-containing protein n=1 Tax=Sphaeroforma arctica JP610 TaxID=667725 RepID=A0A0L0FS12_9EUKA|nr:hypothetical protein SARC_08218 [Sphaeroforma arctica JP610]KNC79391.1 hypothetical protein SARC_08218 [Sphaeroforma arctica JP610]|eukprot:XP_014153293.1 hypothetical protein SARC_08218 [Sphaeroforma arctica JP610]